MSRNKNPNLRAIRRAAERHGARVVLIEQGSRHMLVVFRRSDGSTRQLHVQHGRQDPYKLDGWVRQALAD